MTTMAPLAAPQVDAILASLNQWIEEQTEAAREQYGLYEDYYRGKQKVKLTDRIRRVLPADLQFADNFCQVVVDAMVERLKVTGFSVGTAKEKEEELGVFTQEVWRLNRGDQLQNVVHTQAGMKGDAYVIVDWDAVNERPRLTFNEPEIITPWYDPTTRRILFLAKKWLWKPTIEAEQAVRLNLYYPDRVEKYIARSGKWERFFDAEDILPDPDNAGEFITQWPTPWVDEKGQPIGIPVFHFRNHPAGALFGQSELVSVIPIQDLLNKTLVDLMQVLDVMAWPQRWVMGIEEPNGGWSIQPGAIWHFASTDLEFAQVGQFDQADSKGLLDSIEMEIQHIAGISRTPQHLFHTTGQVPSGEALRTAESGIVHKVELRQVELGNSWEDVMQMAVKLQGIFGKAVTETEDPRIETLWKSPQTNDEKTHLEALVLKQGLGVPQVQLWREAGYDEEEIEKLTDEKAEEERLQKEMEADIGAQMLRRLNAGPDADQ